MKTNQALHEDVLHELVWDPSFSAAGIGVATEDGVVTLTGYVDSYAEKLAAEQAVKRVSGVQAVANDLRVVLKGSHVRDDTTLAKDAVAALRWNTAVPPDKVRVIVNNGWITLEGEVSWQFQRNAAENAVRYLPGVKGVLNEIRFKVVATEANVKQKIEDALQRHAVDAEHIAVECENGLITLRGAVRSWAELSEAEDAAWAAPGVVAVVNRLVVDAHTHAAF